MKLIMYPDNYYIYEKSNNKLLVLGKMSSFGMEWPPTILQGNVVYKFQYQEVMPEWAVGNYYGHASYISE